MRSSMTFASLLALTSVLFSGVSAQAADLQTSLTLDQSGLATGFFNDGQDVPAPGQVRSLTSKNNFINFCVSDLAKGLPITDGKQIVEGSCNPTPMGFIPAVENLPSSKFTNPVNLQVFKTKAPFTISMAIKGMETGAFVNAAANFFAAPQNLNSGGQIIGHSHVVVERLTSYEHTDALESKDFVFFKGLNAPAAGGFLNAEVPGLPAGIYRLSSINTAANHQPVLVPIAQHGSLDDVVYFSVTDDGLPPPGSPTADGKPVAGSSSAVPSASASGSASASASASASVTSAAASSASASAIASSAAPAKASSSAIKPSSAAVAASSTAAVKPSSAAAAPSASASAKPSVAASSAAGSPSAPVKARRGRLDRRRRL